MDCQGERFFCLRLGFRLISFQNEKVKEWVPLLVKRLGLWVLFCFVLLFAFAGKVNAQESLSLLIHPYLSAPELIQRFTPLAERLERRSGKKVTIEISRDYCDHIRRTGKGLADISFLGPASYVDIVRQYGPRRILNVWKTTVPPFPAGSLLYKKTAPCTSFRI